MGISVSLSLPPLSAANKRAMKTWLREQLAADELASNSEIPVRGLAIYVNGEVRLIQYGYWDVRQMASPAVVTGNNVLNVGVFGGGNPAAQPKPERLAILGGIIGCVGLWDDLTADYSRAVGRIILEAYNSCFFDMIQAPQPAVKLAFSADKSQVAVQYRDDESHFYLNNGQPIEGVSTEAGWQIVNA